MFFAGSASGKSETTQTTTPRDSSSAELDFMATKTTEYGKNVKGLTALFPNTRYLAAGNVGGDNRLSLSLENSGENYNIWVDIAMDDWVKKLNDRDMTVGKFLLNGWPETDWNVSGTAGIFDLHLGSKSGYGGWVDTNATWGSWIACNDLNRFGVARGWKLDSDWMHSDHFRTWDAWGHVFALGTQLGDNFKLGLGYRLNVGWSDFVVYGKPTEDSYYKNNSKSSINASFLLSGRPADMITFDLFYSVIGHDDDISARPAAGVGYTPPEASWRNLIGAYVGVNGIENLAISGGYTVNFNAYEAGSYVDPKGDITKSKPVTYIAPIYSGIDLRLGFSGIDRIGLKFNNNVSFASVNGSKFIADDGKDKITLNFAEGGIAPVGVTSNFFNWKSVLQAQLGFIEGVGLEVALLNNYAVNTEDTDFYVVTPIPSTTYTSKVENKGTTKDTNNEFRAVVGAKYGMGNVGLGIALFFQWTSHSWDNESTITSSNTYPGSETTTIKKTSKGNDDVVKFGIPITFSVSF
jgi:hypothetical protein